MLPGVGTKDDIREAQDNGGSICRIATHCTEADVSEQHFRLARELGLETVGFLMMSHTQPPEVLAKQARIMVDAGCQCVYVVDSAGALIMEGVADRVSALVAEIGSEATVGFHGHENLDLGCANTVMAVRAGATQIDGSVRRFGAGAGNTPLDAFVGVCDKLGWRTGVDFMKIIDASEDVVRPAMPEECQLDRMTMMMGYAGVYSSLPQKSTPRATEEVYRAGVASMRPYWYWVLGSPVGFLLVLGIPIAWFALRDLADGSDLAIAIFAVLAIAAVMGFTKAETERIWLFFAPFVCFAAARALLARPAAVTPVLAALAVQALLHELVFDTVW